MAINYNGLLLAVGSSDGVIQIYHVPMLISGIADQALQLSYASHTLSVSDMVFSRCSNRIYSISIDQTCKIYTLDEKNPVCSVSFPTVLNCITISHLEDQLFVGGKDGNIYKINLLSLPSSDFNIMDKRDKLPSIFIGNDSVNSIDINIDGRVIVAGTDEGVVKVLSGMGKCYLPVNANSDSTSRSRQ
jgi:pre-rRNA-processing protein IPI3